MTNATRTFYQNELVIASQDGPVVLPDAVDVRYFNLITTGVGGLWFAVLGPGNDRVYFPKGPGHSDGGFYVFNTLSQANVTWAATGAPINTVCVRGKLLLVVPAPSPTTVQQWDTETLTKVGEFNVDVAIGLHMIVDPRDGGLIFSALNGGIYRLRPDRNVSELLVSTQQSGIFAIDEKFVYYANHYQQSHSFTRFDLDLGVTNQPGAAFANLSNNWYQVRGMLLGPDGNVWVADHIYLEVFTRDTERPILKHHFERGNSQMVFIPTHYVWTVDPSQESTLSSFPTTVRDESSALSKSPITASSPAADNTALIAGAVCGSIGFLVLIALIVFLIRHYRKSQPESLSSMPIRFGDVEMTSARNDYGQLPSAKSHYANGAAQFKEGIPQGSNYDDLPAEEVADTGNHYTAASPANLLKRDSDSARIRAVGRLIDSTELTLGAVLGQGAFGVVRRAEWRQLAVAVKQIKKTTIGATDKAVAEFEAEIGRMATLEVHENVVQLFGPVHLPNGDVGAVMEFCAHGALVDALYGDKAREMTDAQLLRIARGAARGLAHLHAHKIVHRDIAARNVLLAGDMRQPIAKLSDFGMAREIDSAYSGVAEQQTSATIGPVRWMAPEQLERLAYSKASDVFAFGVLLYEIFARSAPWPGLANINVATRVIAGTRMQPHETVPPDMRELMTQCWAHEPKERPSAKAVCASIERK